MKWTVLTLLVTFLISLSLGSDPEIICSYSFDEEGHYRVYVSVYGPPYNGFKNCPGAHEDGQNNTSVRKAIFRGTSPFIPSIICDYFPNIETLTSYEAGLNQTLHVLNCNNLRELSLSQNRILSIESGAFATNQQLKKLNLAQNQITTTHDLSLYQIGELEFLNLSDNPNIEITSGFFQYTSKLRTLYLESCGIEKIDTTWFHNISSLVSLNLSSNPLDNTLTGTTFWELYYLQELNLAYCSIDSLPASIFFFNPHMTYLNLSNNVLTTLEPNTLRNQTALQTLILSHNTFDSLPDDIFLSLTNLRHLHMNRCNIRSLNLLWFSTLNHLRTLNLEGNFIEDIPYGIFGVENEIDTLYLSNNRLKILDATSFADLAQLKDLRVTNNKIFAIDSHFLEQPNLLGNAWFLNNECVNLNIQNFYRDRADNIEKFSDCFDNFDRIPVDFVTTRNESYRWFSMRWNTLVVHIKAEESAKLIFSEIKSEKSNHTLEIHLGMFRNFEDRIYENGNKVWYKIDRNVLRDDEWVSFVVSWNFKVLTVYKQGYQLPFAMHTIREPFNINFFGIASDMVNATWHINKMEENFLHDEFPIPILPTTTTEATTVYTTTTTLDTTT